MKTQWEVPFTTESVDEGYWEIYHDDDCGQTLEYGFCPKCGFRPDMQSLGARATAKNRKLIVVDR